VDRITSHLIVRTCRVQANDGGADKGGATECKKVLGCVVEQNADVERRTGNAKCLEKLSPAAALIAILAVRPTKSFEEDGWAI